MVIKEKTSDHLDDATGSDGDEGVVIGGDEGHKKTR